MPAPPSPRVVELGLHMGIQPLEWEKAFRDINKIAISAQQRSFIYRYLNLILYGNKELKKFNIKENENCNGCNLQQQTIMHLLFECPKTLSFKGQVNDHFNLQQQGSDKCWLVGNDCLSENVIRYQAIRYMYHANLNDSQCVLQEFKCQLKNDRDVEYDIAKNNDKIVTHLKKWDKVLI